MFFPIMFSKHCVFFSMLLKGFVLSFEKKECFFGSEVPKQNRCTEMCHIPLAQCQPPPGLVGSSFPGGNARARPAPNGRCFCGQPATQAWARAGWKGTLTS